MKRIIFFIAILISFPIITFAKDDVLKVEEMSTYIIITGYNTYQKDDTIKTSIVFGDNPITTSYLLKLPKSGIYIPYGSRKQHSYSIKNAFYISDNEDDVYLYSLDSDDKSDMVFIGRAELLNENEEFNISYNVSYDSYKNSGEYNLAIVDSEYAVNSTNFEVVLPVDSENLEYLFSINNKDFYKSMNGLDYKISDGKMIGNYKNKLAVDEGIYLKIIEDYTTYKTIVKNIIIFSIITLVSLYCIFSIIKYMKKNK